VQTLILVCDIVMMYLWGWGGVGWDGGKERILKLKDVSMMESVDVKMHIHFMNHFTCIVFFSL